MSDKSIDEFCAAKGISRSTYFQLRRNGFGPEEVRYPGTRVVRITAVAEQAWDARMAELAKGETVKLEAARRVEIAAAAGRAAAASVKHVSRRAARRPRRMPAEHSPMP